MTTGGSIRRQANPALVAEQAVRCFELKAQGQSLRQIGAQIGLSAATVGKRIEQHCKTILTPVVEDYRKIQDQTLDALQQSVQGILDSSDDPDVQMKAVDRIGRILERRAKLHGLDAPTKTEATVVVQTQTEVELEALFAAQDAANAVVRAGIEATP